MFAPLINAGLLLVLGVSLVVSSRLLRSPDANLRGMRNGISLSMLGWVCILVSAFGPIRALIGVGWGLALCAVPRVPIMVFSA